MYRRKFDEAEESPQHRDFYFQYVNLFFNPLPFVRPSSKYRKATKIDRIRRKLLRTSPQGSKLLNEKPRQL